jgi:hypothetical protein
VVKLGWFINAVKQAMQNKVDCIVVLGHFDLKDECVETILSGIRAITDLSRPNIPIEFVTGHTHYRYFPRSSRLLSQSLKSLSSFIFLSPRLLLCPCLGSSIFSHPSLVTSSSLLLSPLLLSSSLLSSSLLLSPLLLSPSFSSPPLFFSPYLLLLSSLRLSSVHITSQIITNYHQTLHPPLYFRGFTASVDNASASFEVIIH